MDRWRFVASAPIYGFLAGHPISMSSSATATRTPRVTVLVPVKSRTPTAASTSSNQDRGSAESTRPDTRIHILPYAAASLPAIAANSTRFIVIQPDQRHDPRGVLVNTIREIFSEMRLLMWEDPTPLEPILNGGITPSSAWNLFANPLDKSKNGLGVFLEIL